MVFLFYETTTQYCFGWLKMRIYKVLWSGCFHHNLARNIFELSKALYPKISFHMLHIFWVPCKVSASLILIFRWKKIEEKCPTDMYRKSHNSFWSIEGVKSQYGFLEAFVWGISQSIKFFFRIKNFNSECFRSTIGEEI